MDNFEKIKEKYLELVELIKEQYNLEYDKEITTYDEDYLLENDLPELLSNIFIYLDEGGE